ncbi:MAG: hypothetical protein ACO39X_07095, partial [Candidatus Nanopelagicaceae bacterium]
MTLLLLGLVVPLSSPATHGLVAADCDPVVTGFTKNSTVTYAANGNSCIITFRSGSGTWTPPNGVNSVNVL